jgi:hypothetical protein
LALAARYADRFRFDNILPFGIEGGDDSLESSLHAPKRHDDTSSCIRNEGVMAQSARDITAEDFFAFASLGTRTA